MRPITASSARRASSTAIFDGMAGSYLGPEYGDDEIAERLTKAGAKFTKLTQRTDDRTDGTGAGRRQGGGLDAGPHGVRPALARCPVDPGRRPLAQHAEDAQSQVKYRESFRPFAPAVLREDLGDFFDIKTDSPYMLMVAPVNENRRRSMTAEEQALFGIDKLNVPRSDIPAVTMSTIRARIQTRAQGNHPAFHDLLESFQGQDWLRGGVEHLVQLCAASRSCAHPRRLSLLHGQRDRGAGWSATASQEGRPGSGLRSTTKRLRARLAP